MAIENLTEAQKAALPHYVEKWLDIGLDTAPIDRAKAIDAVNLAYQCGGLPPPGLYIFAPSPPAGHDCARIINGEFFQTVWSKIDDLTFLSNLPKRKSGHDPAWENLWQQIDSQIGPFPTLNVILSLEHRSNQREPTTVDPNAGFGSLEAGWLSFYDFFRTECGIVGCDILQGLFAVARECGWWFPYNNICVITEKPVAIHWDANKRTHCADGMAITYSDGWGVYIWHGRRTPREIIMDPVTIEKIDKEKNVEFRRILIERYGEKQYVEDSGAVIVDTDDWGTLYRKDEPNDDPIYRVKVICPTTGREYTLGIDPGAYGGRAGREARAAVASTWRYDEGGLVFNVPEDYTPVVET